MTSTLLPLSEMQPEAKGAVASLKVVKRNGTSCDDCVDQVREVRFWDKLQALETPAKHFGLLVESVEVSDSSDLVGRLEAARQRGQ